MKMAANQGRPDYLAELYVAGLLADSGWNIYFPHRDEGFDFIISKCVEADMILRPVQVKGKYPTTGKTNITSYGSVSKLCALHPEMVLAIPYFSRDSACKTPLCTAYMPLGLIRRHSKGYRCQPANSKDGRPQPKRDHRQFFDAEGIRLLELPNWSQRTVIPKSDS